MIVGISGVFYDSAKGAIPNTSTIRLTNAGKNDVNEYILETKDIAKLDLIATANDGSFAFCTDKTDGIHKKLIKHCGKWVEI